MDAEPTQLDAVIYATGYRQQAGFADPAVVDMVGFPMDVDCFATVLRLILVCFDSASRERVMTCRCTKDASQSQTIR